MLLSYDFDNLLARTLGSFGVSDEEFFEFASKRQSPISLLLASKKSFPLGWVELEKRIEDIKIINRLTSTLSDYDLLVTIGMGGSSLGTRAIVSAFCEQVGRRAFKKNEKIFLLLDTIEDFLIEEVLEKINGKRVILNPVSKSGTTLECLANFFLLLERIPEHRRAVVVTTTFGEGPLARFSEQMNYPLLCIPADIGGRFSALTSVAFFPLAFLGINVQALLEGALEAKGTLLRDDFFENPSLRLSALTILLYQKHGINELVLMPYSLRLYDFTYWWSQLVAESVGKAVGEGPLARVEGLTPISALGPADQHSLLQLILDGPRNKICGFIKVEEEVLSRNPIVQVPKSFTEHRYLIRKSLGSIRHAQLNATRSSLVKKQVPNYLISFPRLTEECVGEFVFFFELTVTMMGLFLGINPFDQPAVESIKKLAQEELSS